MGFDGRGWNNQSYSRRGGFDRRADEGSTTSTPVTGDAIAGFISGGRKKKVRRARAANP